MGRVRKFMAPVLAAAIAVGSSGVICGCGSGGSAAPATISPDMQAKTQEMLNNKSKQMADYYKSKAKSKTQQQAKGKPRG